MEEDRRIRKKKRRINKKIELLLLIELINDFGFYNSLISVREILKNNKINVTIIDLVV